MAKKKAKPAAMSPNAFRAMLAAAQLNHTQAALKLDVNRRTIIRWAYGTTNISAASAALIKAVLKAK